MILSDWSYTEPAIAHYRSKWNRKVFENFEWLGDSVRRAAESRREAITHEPTDRHVHA